MAQNKTPSSVFSTNPDANSTRVAVRENSADIRTERFQPPADIQDTEGSADPEKIMGWIKVLCPQLERFQQQLKDQTLPVRSNRAIFANTFLDIEFENGTDQVIKHGLGKPYKGWRVCRVRVANANVYEVPNDANNPTNSANLDASQITLRPGATFTADLEVW